MRLFRESIFFLSIPLILLIFLKKVQGCNEAICVSVVSKCMLTQSCNCDLIKCSCCLECSQCLGFLYSECCSCVDLCPKTNETHDLDLSTKSHVEDFPQNFPQLFQALTKEPDPEERWDSFMYEIVLKPKKTPTELEVKEFQGIQDEEKFVINCTVAYFSNCMPYAKCKTNCQSLGASSYRWFHDGCCQCIGESCINYGINENRCKKCPDYTVVFPEGEEQDLDFG